MMRVISCLFKDFFIRFAKVKRNRNKHKKALLSFIVHPYFKKENKVNHPNILELNYIVNTLDKLGYAVDVVDYRRKKINGRYDLVIGFGDCYEYALEKKISKKYILYSTGSPLFYQNQQTIEALYRFKLNNPKVKVSKPEKYIRLVENIWVKQLISSDAIITIGNEFTESLFRKFHANVYSIPATYFESTSYKQKNPKELEKQSILWFGGKGSIHKGLDLCIAAVIRTNIKLYIAGSLDDEISIYQHYLDKYPNNIEYIGLLKINTDRFNEFVSKIPFVVLPSCSEGMATSILTLVCNYGTIPIVTKQCGINITNDAIEIESLTIQAVKNALKKAMALGEEDIISTQKRVLDSYRKMYPKIAFERQFHDCLKLAVND